jgi:D-sedoheptulose 7-phosphate isomerase
MSWEPDETEQNEDGEENEENSTVPRSFSSFPFGPIAFNVRRHMTFDASLAETLKTFQALPTIRAEIDRAGRMIVAALQRGNKLLVCGNGGSAAEAAHFATELVGRYAKTRRSLPAVALSSDGSLLSCIGNDFGYEQVFSRQLAGLAQKGDLVVVLTSSGNSANIVAALHEAKRLGLESIAFLGRGGGKAKGLATCDLIMPGNSGAAAQESHLFLIHHFCELIDEAFPA